MTKLKISNFGFRICFEIRYSDFEFMERIWNSNKDKLRPLSSSTAKSVVNHVPVYSCLSTASGGSPKTRKVLRKPTITARPIVANRLQPRTVG